MDHLPLSARILAWIGYFSARLRWRSTLVWRFFRHSVVYSIFRLFVLAVIGFSVVRFSWGWLSAAVPKISDRANIAVALSTFSLAIITVWTNLSMQDESRRLREYEGLVILEPEVMVGEMFVGSEIQINVEMISVQDPRTILKKEEPNEFFIRLHNTGRGPANNLRIATATGCRVQQTPRTWSLGTDSTVIFRVTATRAPREVDMMILYDTAFGQRGRLRLDLLHETSLEQAESEDVEADSHLWTLISASNVDLV